MKANKIILIVICFASIAGCKPKKSVTATSSTPVSVTTPTTITTTTPTVYSVFSKPAISGTGIYSPGNEELTAIQTKYEQYKDATLEQLKEGYTIYTEGACIKCHRALNIYVHEEMKWKKIIDNMAMRANITDEQKDAVYKYVLAIKATQPK